MKLLDWIDCGAWEAAGMPCPFRRRREGKKKEKGEPSDDTLDFGFGERGERRKGTRVGRHVRAATALGFSLKEAKALSELAERVKDQVGKPGRIPVGVPVAVVIAAMVLGFSALAGRYGPSLATARMVQRQVIRSTRFNRMTGGRGGWHVDMSMLGRQRRNAVRSVSPRHVELRRPESEVKTQGHPGN